MLISTVCIYYSSCACISALCIECCTFLWHTSMVCIILCLSCYTYIHIYLWKVLLHIAVFDGWLSECYRSLAFHRNKLFSTFSGIENLWRCTIQAMTTSFQTVIHHLVLNLWVLRNNEGYYICKKVDALLVYSLLYTVLHWSCFDVAICVKAMSPFNCIPVGV